MIMFYDYVEISGRLIDERGLCSDQIELYVGLCVGLCVGLYVGLCERDPLRGGECHEDERSSHCDALSGRVGSGEIGEVLP